MVGIDKNLLFNNSMFQIVLLFKDTGGVGHQRRLNVNSTCRI